MNFLFVIAAIFIVTETINPGVDEVKNNQKDIVVVEKIETKPTEEINFEAQAEAQAQAEAEERAKAKAEAEERAKAEAEERAKAEADARAKAQAEAEARAAVEAKARAAEAEAQAAEKEINYLKIALYIILILAALTGVLLYFRNRDKSPSEGKIVPPERKAEQPVQEETRPETREEQPIDNVNKEPTNFEETNKDEKK